MKIKILPLFLIIIFFLIFVIFYLGLQNPNIYTPKIKLKEDIPSFKAKIFEQEIKINSEKIFNDDKFYLLNIWASWCIPCRDEHFYLTKLSSEKKLNIVGLNYKDNDKNAKSFLNKLTNPYDIILSDRDGLIAIEWGAYGVPESFLIHDKKIIKKIIGPIKEDSLVEIINLIK